ncbi:glycosyltransferase family 2 protein [Superficieibacter sp. 1612_C1]|uniref:glycosyltransferase family 2 protein n=1 Tax=Superficieibacter sp. 1612_C1 TaxID=2780382 RepID=UPI0018841854|nr:glycosyltransferase [Superficieibacter sp. 1612_C1]
MSSSVKVGIAVVTYNGGKVWEQAAHAIHQNCQPGTDVLVVDSQSRDNTQQVARQYGFTVHEIAQSEFNHGGTRNVAMDVFRDKDYVVLLTQDAILASNDAVAKLVSYMVENDLSAAYGKQLPHLDANAVAAHARYFNYGDRSLVNQQQDIPLRGIKTVFMSNSFSAYKVADFQRLGGFPTDTILCEDMYFAARAIQQHLKTGYCADAAARHSHNYSTTEEFKRYFDIGVFHYDEPWIQKEFNGVSSEGSKFIKSEVSYLIKHNPLLLPKAFANNAAKLLGYKLGLKYKSLPFSLVKKMSMHRRYWDSSAYNR